MCRIVFIDVHIELLYELLSVEIPECTDGDTGRGEICIVR